MQTARARALREDDQPIARRTRRFERAAAEPVPLRRERRTIVVTGHPVPPRRRRSPTQQQIVARPDRVALWAFLLGLFLVLVAAATAHAAVI
jgi:hypothetical protein